MFEKRSSLAKNSIYYSLSTLVCMVIPLALYPYITRVLGPAYFGKVAFQQTLISYFVIVATLGINNYAQKVCAVCRGDKTALSKATYEILLIAAVLTGFSLVSYIVTVFLLDIDISDYPLYFLSVGTIIFSSLRMDWLLIAEEKFLFTSIRNVISKLAFFVCCVCLIRKREDFIYYGFAIAMACSFLPAILNYIYLRLDGTISSVKFDDILIKRHLRPIVFLSLVTIGSKVFSSFDIIMLRFFQDDISVGIYNNAIKIPLVLDELLMVIAAVVTPRMYLAVANDDEAELYHLINKSSNTMFFFAIPAIITCVFYSQVLIEILGGKEYLSGSNILVVYSFIMLTTLCLTIAGTRMFIARGWEKQLFVFLLIAGCGNIALNAVMIPRFGSLGAALATVTSNVCLLIAELKYANTSKYLFDKDKLKYLISGAVLTLVFAVVGRSGRNDVGNLFLAIIIGGLFYVFSLAALKESTVTRIMLSLKASFLKNKGLR